MFETRRPARAPTVAVELAFEGRRLGPAFEVFLYARASRLGLACRVLREPDRVVARLEGHPALIDMFEVAAILGPVEALVDAVTLRDADAAPMVTAG